MGAAEARKVGAGAAVGAAVSAAMGAAELGKIGDLDKAGRTSMAGAEVFTKAAKAPRRTRQVVGRLSLLPLAAVAQEVTIL